MVNFKRLFSLLLLTFGLIISIYAQNVQITGLVVDSDDIPIIGATVAVKNVAGEGTITDMDGKFSIDVKKGSILVFSYIGMKSQEMTVTNSSPMKIKMISESVDLEEVVVVGYGSQSVRKVSSAVTKMKTDKVENVPYSNMASALSGLGQGLIIKQSGGGPGNDVPNISIRGGGEPLYVIDGMISTKSSFARLSANDIDNISLLKDAGASAIYGSRASNGVVLVTTKNATSDRISYSNNFSFSTPTVNPAHLNSYEYVSFVNNVADATGVNRPYTDEQVQKYLDGTDPNYTSTIFYDEVFRKFAPSNRHNLTFQGSEKSIKYLLSFTASKQNSRFQDQDLNYNKVYSVLGKITKEYKKIGLEIDSKLSANLQNKRGLAERLNYYETFTAINATIPILRPFNDQGNYMQINGIKNPFYVTDSSNGYTRNNNNEYNGTLFVKWNIPWVEGLKIGVNGNYTINTTHDKSFTNLQPFYDVDNNPIYQEKPSLSETKTNSSNWTVQAYVNYDKTIKKHTIGASLYYEAYEYKYNLLSASRKDFMSGAIDELFFGSQNGLGNNGKSDESARLAYIGRLSYDYADKYFLVGSFRYDASERFRKEDRWGFFPSFSAAWRISGEEFTKDLFKKIRLDDLKLRLSYGKVGNDDIARFAYMSTFSVIDKCYMFGDNWNTGIYSDGLPAGDISWYSQTDYNVGLETSWLDYRLKMTVDAFYYRISGFLKSPNLDYSAPLGFALPKINSGSQRRGGFEFNINWQDKIGSDFEYGLGLNMTHYETLWEENPDESEVNLLNPYIRTTHQGSNYWGIGYINDGYYQSMDDILNSPRLNGQVEMLPGDLKYKDMNGDGKIDSYDQRRIGYSSEPRMYYAFNGNISYKGLYVNALIQGAANYSMQMKQHLMFERGASEVTLNKLTDVWTPENPNARYPRINVTGGRVLNQNLSDFWLVDAKYVRLKSLEIGYDLKRDVFKNLKFINKMNVFFSGTNLLTFAPGLMGLMDPENGAQMQFNTYPVDKTFSFGLNLEF